MRDRSRRNGNTQLSSETSHMRRTRKRISRYQEESAPAGHLSTVGYRSGKSSYKPLKQVGAFRRFWHRHNLTKISLIVIGLCFVLGGGYLFYLSKTANVEDLEAGLKAKTILYDKDNQEAGVLTGGKGTYVELSQISKYMQDAVIATEDRSFYKNSGVSLRRTVLSIMTFGKSGGGSTITQQLAKNAYLTQERTLDRKLKEFFLAIEINKKWSKEQILTMYLNHAYFGNGVWGVEDASNRYFGCHASELDLSEAATLAGMLKGPEIYNPLYSIENAKNRRDTVLQSMGDAKYLTEDEIKTAENTDLASQLANTYQPQAINYAYPSYFDAVIQEAETLYGLSEKDLIEGGYRIYTAMDQQAQASMQAIYDDTSLFPIAADGVTAEAACVAASPIDGGVRALVGRVNSSQGDFRSFNFATQAKRSPGSTIKPLVDYAPAIEDGWTMDQLLDNHTTTYGNYTLHNYSGQISGDVPMYQALAESLNLPAVYTANKIGLDTVVSYGKKFGFKLDKADKKLPLAIGSGVTTNPMEMAQAYTAFANGGKMQETHLITKIESASGREVAHFKGSSKRVLSRETADQMTAMMLGVFTNGTGASADVYGYNIAGKTGTTETSFDGSLINDQWVIGYTPDIVISQWVGYEKPDQSHYISYDSWKSDVLFRSVAKQVLLTTPGTAFDVKNAYVTNGQLVKTDGQSQEQVQSNGTDTSEDDASSSQWKQKADEIIENAKNGIKNADIPGRAKNLWDNIVDFFS